MIKFFKISNFILLIILSIVFFIYNLDIISLNHFSFTVLIISIIISALNYYLTKELTDISNKLENANKSIENYYQSSRKLREEKEQLSSKISQLSSEIMVFKNEFNEIIKLNSNFYKAIRPYKKRLSKSIKDFFILSYPLSEIGEDLLYFAESNGYNIIALIDPSGKKYELFLNGELIFELLNYIIYKKRITKPSLILNFLYNFLLTEYKYDSKNFPFLLRYNLSILSILKTHKIIEFSGAGSSIFYTFKDQLFIQKGAPRPINNFIHSYYDYKNNGIPYLDNSIIYLYTDGFANQYLNGKKLKRKKLYEIISLCHQMPLNEQHKIIKKHIDTIFQTSEQIDDFCFLAIKI